MGFEPIQLSSCSFKGVKGNIYMVVIVGDCRQKVTEIFQSITKQYILGSKNQDFLLLKEKNGIFDQGWAPGRVSHGF